MITTEQKKWTKEDGWKDTSAKISGSPQLVLAFGGSNEVSEEKHFKELRKMYPEGELVMASTAGEILGTTVSDNTIVVTAVHFDKTDVRAVKTSVVDAEGSEAAGLRLAKELPQDGLTHAMVFSDGLHVNGTALVAGLAKGLPNNVSVTGGLVGDGADFKHTFVGLNEAGTENQIVLVGFYGSSLRVGYGSLGGWDPFGPERVITKSKNNILYELDGQPALELYKQYLGDKAAGLPGTGLLFPLSLRMKNGGGTEVVRTLLGIEEKTGGMIFAGDMPEGAPAKLMKANFDRLIDGASGAASKSVVPLAAAKPELAVLISCIGRKLVLKERIEEEVEAVQSIVGKQAAIVGFYSYGELCPTAPTEKQCQLHNQTMTITVLREE